MAVSSDSNRFSFDFKIFSILLLLAVIPLLVGTWMIFRSYESAYLDVVGMSLNEAAVMAHQSLDNYLQRQIMAVAALTEIPILRDSVARENRSMENRLEEIRKSIPAIENAWVGMDPQSPEVKSILDNPASEFLRRYVEVEKAYRDIWVTDYLGRLVASTSKPPNYYFAPRNWWKETYGDGQRGSVYIADIHYDPQSKSSSWELAQPFVAPGGGVFGAIFVIVDAQEIYSLIENYRAGPFATAALLRGEGEVISAPGYSIRERRPYDDAKEILSSRDRAKPYVVTGGETPTITSWSYGRFMEKYPHLDWMVITSGSVEKVTAPLALHRSYFVTLLVVVVLLSLIATLVLSRVESTPMIEQDPHLETL